MGIVILIVSILFFRERIKNEQKKDQLMLFSALILYILFSLFLTWYLREVYLWPNGIPGSDLKKYYEGAVALKNGTNYSNLARISSTFEVSLAHFGYLAYITFIAVTVLTPIIINLDISLEILYIIQCIVAIIACLNIADFFCNNKIDKTNRWRVFWMLSLCTSVMQMSTLLMRDIWILFFISLLMQECKKEDNSLWMSIILILVCFISRYYTLVITIPILLGYKFNQKKTATIVSLVVFGAFFAGQNLINIIAKHIGIGWGYQYHFDLHSMASYIMFPSPFNQAYNVQHMNMTSYAFFGGNTEWIYYLLSCWNVFVFPVSIYGIYKSIKDKEGQDAALWGLIIINIAMLMCLFYNAVSSPRHKLLIVMSLAYFFKKGTESLSVLTRVLYFFIIAISLVIIFAIA